MEHSVDWLWFTFARCHFGQSGIGEIDFVFGANSNNIRSICLAGALALPCLIVFFDFFGELHHQWLCVLTRAEAFFNGIPTNARVRQRLIKLEISSTKIGNYFEQLSIIYPRPLIIWSMNCIHHTNLYWGL